jgi:hypothetical protein
LADVTPHELLKHIVAICDHSSSVTAYAVRTLDLDVLSLRVYLVDDSFIEVFHNVRTGKTAFALIVGDRRAYGKDNVKMGWHVHPPRTTLKRIVPASRSLSKRSSPKSRHSVSPQHSRDAGKRENRDRPPLPTHQSGLIP